MNAAHRWWSVGIGVVLLVATPVLVRARPVPDEQLTAGALLQRIQASREVAFSGYTESKGTAALPRNNALSGLTQLMGDTNRVRVWWQGPRTWRTSTLRPTGETDLVHTGHRMVRWVYESKRATLIPDVRVRLPNTADLLPNELARRTLSGARPAEVSRIGARRVAGHDALGLRLTPADPQAAIGRVDVFADRATGVPLEVQVFAKGAATPVLTSSFLDFTAGRPAASAVSFTPPADARLRYDDVVDLAAAADRFASRIPPKTLAGLPARQAAEGSVGVYGRGPTVLLAVPLWHRTADQVREQLRNRPGVATIDQGIVLGAAPLQLLLANPEHNDNSWLVAGTVTQRTLVAAANQLAAHRPGLRVR